MRVHGNWQHENRGPDQATNGQAGCDADESSTPEGEHRSLLVHLNEPSPAARVPAIAAGLAKLDLLEGLLGAGVDLSATAPQLLQHLAQLKRFAAPRRHALTAPLLPKVLVGRSEIEFIPGTFFASLRSNAHERRTIRQATGEIGSAPNG